MAIAPQEPAASELDPANLTLDALIERLPPVFQEEERVGDAVRLHPISAELARRLQAGIPLSSDQWRRALLESGALRLPRRWPAGLPYAVSALMPGWMGKDTVLILDPLQAGLRRARVGSFNMGWCGTSWDSITDDLRNQELGELSLGHHQIPVRLDLRRATPKEQWFGLHPWLEDYLERREGAARGVPTSRGLEPRLPLLLSTGALLLEVEIVPTLDEAVTPIDTPELGRAVRQSLAVSFEGGDPAMLRVRPVPGLERIGLSLEIEVLRGSEVVERARLHPTHDYEGFRWSRGECFVELLSLPGRVQYDSASLREWSLRVRGTDIEILHSWADSRWAGTLELTLEELLERGAELERR